ncbi:MAG: hypothetical protein EVA59_13300 [Limnobacter sp.]|uniref:EH signature domain-containing protein n=1 Tax=Limnobacter sp. TaxID=2003368 RepID=UPI00121951E3|nr:EH signature domain-containing protein [Limnobacter sp.]RZO91449.1 MAG: hypothetical protein EVA59_13300 [Limnobacter sp.]
MSTLSNLQRLLEKSEKPTSSFPDAIEQLEKIIESLKSHNQGSSFSDVQRDHQKIALTTFWEQERLETLKEARLVSFGMCIPHRHGGTCILEDRKKFQAVLDSASGIEQWISEPRWYRRCYQGLVRSYFEYDPQAAETPSIGKKNWSDLRDYLSARVDFITDTKNNPSWVETATTNREVFGESPCSPYAANMLVGETAKVDALCEQLGVLKSSWFLKELVLAQIIQATKFSDERFERLIPQLLNLLSDNLVLRDRGLIHLLDRYARSPSSGINEPLRNSSVDWWGNPWLPSNESRWGGVKPATREMIADWLKREFIESFFSKLAQDGVGDKRRANFWLRYVKSMSNVQFALGAHALYSRDKDFEVLRRKMEGLYTTLMTNDRLNNAFVMTIGNLIAVEFGGSGNAFYGYDKSGDLPFDMLRPVDTTVDAKNSLKRSDKIIWLKHKDGIHGWSKWEEMFAATLKQHFNILPDSSLKVRKATVPPPAPSPQAVTPKRPEGEDGLQSPKDQAAQQLSNSGMRFSTDALRALAREYSLEVDDHRDKNGNLWVRADNENRTLSHILTSWGFKYKALKGWWR